VTALQLSRKHEPVEKVGRGDDRCVAVAADIDQARRRVPVKMPKLFIFALVAGPMPWKLAYRQRFHERRSHFRCDDILSVRLPVI
jgi:hypothetical protein